MGNEQSGFSQKHLIDPVDARISQQAREREAARLANQRQRSNQDSAPAPAPESRASNPLSNVEPAGDIMSPSQQLSGQRKTSSRRSSRQHNTSPPQSVSSRQRSKSKSNTPTPSKKSAPRQSIDADNDEIESPGPGPYSSDPVPTSPPFYPETFEDDTSSEGSDDSGDPCLKIRYGRRKLRAVLKDLQEMHRVARGDIDTLTTENERLRDENQRSRDDNERLQDYNQDLHLDNEHFRSINRQMHEENQGLRDDVQYHSAANRQAGTRLQELWNEIEDLRETNGDPQNENAELRRSNRNLRADLHDHLDMHAENQELRRANSSLGNELDDLQRQTGGGIADWTRRFVELQRIANDAEDASDVLRNRLQDVEPRLIETNRQLVRATDEITRLQATQDESDRLRLQLRDVQAQLAQSNQHLGRAISENNRLQTTLAQVHEGNSDPAGSHPTRPAPSEPAPRGSSASRGASPPGARDPTPESSPSPRPPRGGRSAPAAAAPTRRMNTRSQVTGDARSRTPPSELWSPQRAGPAATARTQRRNASKPTGVSKSKKETTKTKRSRK
jgi:regulator of replication initiation timing